MPQLQDLVINDRKATPVAHTFTPRDIVGNVATVVESTGTPAGNNTISLSLRRTPTGRHKVQIQGVFPVVATETINGIAKPTVVRVARAKLEFDFDDFSTEAERNDVVGMLSNALAVNKTLVHDTLVKLQNVY